VAAVDDATDGVISLKLVLAAADDAETMRIGSEKEEEKKFEGGGAPTISEEGDNRVCAFVSQLPAPPPTNRIHE
jgi:hypothetical protein